ncbi:hypothetical protein FHR90_003434 [Endobacter medicaginis]|uniref:HK97 family phage prohead protease n=1 Tax=Endobacter medicaginis TaxID=1181271 RepID=A0A839V456_9PROT|nr:HK97 family phage prohead protease [Endobacter medicaginis]MBB3175573.1 hypothetical protein [Endobacter medicaginis]MCX5477215.1 HK97 family phage prohead protease [Endobacter medicaginis]NVN30602.1 HK97 family phage prohead protease [Endobacter medicaginis]
MVAAGIETRSAVAELRAAGRKLEGYAAVFGQEARIGTFDETIRQGAFTGTLADGLDKLGLVDHDPTRLLARTSAGTLRLSQDSRGLAFEMDLPATSLGNDIRALAESRNLGGMSFAFTIAPGGDSWIGDKRTSTSLALHEISVVQAFPAYSGTSVSARARQFGSTSPVVRRRVLAMMGGHI